MYSPEDEHGNGAGGGPAAANGASRVALDLARLVEEGGEGVIAFDAGHRYAYVNEPAAALMGFPPDALIGRTLWEAMPELAATPVEAHHRRAVEGRAPVRYTEFFPRYQAWYSVRLLPTDDGGALCFFRDVTTEKRLEKDRERLLGEQASLLAEQARLRADAESRARIDPLTGLLNHGAFHARLRAATGDVALVLLDVHNFKLFNETYGHTTGDGVLSRIACVFASVLSALPGADAGRVGGDEFALLVPAREGAEVERLIRAVRARLAGLDYTPPGAPSPVPIGVAAGWALLPGEAKSPDAAYRLADTRLLRDKVGDQTYGSEALREALRESVDGFEMLDALVTAVDNKDRYTRRHSEDVLLYAVMVADELGLPEPNRASLMISALLHDVGKIGVPDRVLRSPGRLTEADFAVMKQHPVMGAALVAAIPGLDHGREAILHHHEHWDGSGYPDGLSGEHIPLLSRVLAVADAFSAMTTDRPYRKGLPKAEALARLRAGSGTQWDPRCVAALAAVRQG